MSGDHVCDHGVPFPEYCAKCDEPWPRSKDANEHERQEIQDIIDYRYRGVLGGQGKSAASVRSSGVWAGVAILALSAGTVVWMLLRWFSRF